MVADKLAVTVAGAVLDVMEAGADRLDAMAHVLDVAGADHKLEATVLFASMEWAGEELGVEAVRKIRQNHV